MSARVRWAVATAALAVAALAIAVLAPALATPARADRAAGTARATGTARLARTTASQAQRPVPVLAYYYIWFNPSSWNRAKVDYPLLGRYSSDDVSVLREQVRLAEQAGITGFLVSWKDTPVLDRRLAKLRAVAAAAHFKLGIVFEGRDFHGKPLPMAQVRGSFAYLAAHYASDPVFNIFGRLMVAWSGTWTVREPQLAAITHAFGARLMIFAMEKQPAQFRSVAGLFAGDAYYWSSADPLHTPGYAQKLNEFSTVAHRAGKLWIAPAAPGFDAKPLGHTRVIPRRGGQTLRLEMNAAMNSSPDAIGLISWNEYSENSEVEPSRLNGTTALKVLATIEHAKPPVLSSFDSSGPSGFHPGLSPFIILAILLVLLFGSIGAIIGRRKE